MERWRVAAVLGVLLLTPCAALAQEQEAHARLNSVPDGTVFQAQKWTHGSGGHSSGRKGAVIGAVIGGAAGLVGAIIIAEQCQNEGGTCYGPELSLIALGIGAGAGIGWAVDSWTQRTRGIPLGSNVTLHPQVAAVKRPGGGRAGVRAGLSASVGW